MSAVQNQGMRERLLANHRATVSRFGVEVAMLLEGELMRRVYGKPRPAAAGEPSGAWCASCSGLADRRRGPGDPRRVRRRRQGRPDGAGAVQ